MKRIGYISFYQNDASAFYRTTGVLSYIKSNEFELVNLSHVANQLSSVTLSGYYALIIQRPNEDRELNLIKAAKDAGLKIISDYDDNCIHVDIYNPLYDHFNASKQNIIDCLTLSDEVWVGTEAIKKAYRLYNNNIHIFPNCHNDILFPDTPVFEYNQKAMFRGGFSHEGDMYEIGIPEMVIDMVNDNPDWQFHFWGQRYIYLEKRFKHGNFVRNQGGSTVQFYKMMHREHCCVFWYPLANTVFNRGKSNCSWLESVYSGSAYFGNTDLPQFKLPGVKPLSEMKETMNCPEILESMWEESWEHLRENYMLSKVNEGRTERLLDI